MRITYYTASTVNGFLATPDDSLDWLFAVPEDGLDIEGFQAGVTALVMGSTTYEWVLAAAGLLESPELWTEFFGARPSFVFTTRELPVPAGADVWFVSGPVADVLPQLADAAGDGVLWVQGGGDLAGQFADIGALDEIVISLAPVFLADGRELLPRNLFSDRIVLTGVQQRGQFAEVTYAVRPLPEVPAAP